MRGKMAQFPVCFIWLRAQLELSNERLQKWDSRASCFYAAHEVSMNRPLRFFDLPGFM